MIEYSLLAALIAVFAGLYCLVAGFIIYHASLVIRMMIRNHKDRKILKTAERCRRDFA